MKRSEKYANVLAQEEIPEEKISLTREFKFKELQEYIDLEEKAKTQEIGIKKEHIEQEKRRLREEISSKELTEEDLFLDVLGNKKEDSIRINQVSTGRGKTREDLYLTKSLRPVKLRKKVGHALISVFIVLFISLSLTVASYFYVYPLIQKYFFTTPKIVFDTSIDTATDKLLESLELLKEEQIEESIYNELKLGLESNIEELEGMNDYKFGFSLGYDTKNKDYEQSIFIEKENKKYGIENFVKEENSYSAYIGFDALIEEGKIDTNTFFQEVTEETDTFLSDTIEDFHFIINTHRTILKKLIKEKDLSVEVDELTVHGKTEKVKRHTWYLKEEDLISFFEEYKKELLSNEEYIEAYGRVMDLSSKEVKEEIEANYTYKESESIKVNIYTTNDYKFRGIDMEENGFRVLYVYLDENNNFTSYLNASEDYEQTDNAMNDQCIIEINGKKKEDILEIELFYNKKELLTLGIREWCDEKIDVDYSLWIEEYKVHGNLSLTLSDTILEGTVSIEYEEKYGKISFYLEENTNKKIADISSKKIATQEEINVVEDEFIRELEEDEVIDVFYVFYEFMTNPITYTEENINNENFEFL